MTWAAKIDIPTIRYMRINVRYNNTSWKIRYFKSTKFWKRWNQNTTEEMQQIEGTSSYVRVSQLKKQAVDKLIANVDHSQVLDYL